MAPQATFAGFSAGFGARGRWARHGGTKHVAPEAAAAAAGVGEWGEDRSVGIFLTFVKALITEGAAGSPGGRHGVGTLLRARLGLARHHSCLGKERARSWRGGGGPRLVGHTPVENSFLRG